MQFDQARLLYFHNPRFLLFFGIVFLVYWLLRWHRARKVWLLAASYFFYSAWDVRFLALIVFSTAVDFLAGQMIERHQNKSKLWLFVSIAANLGVLGFFKYCNFFADSALELLAWLGLPVGFDTLQIILPVGISFFTFQTMSYTIDIYRRRMKPVDDVGDFALYVAFFPQLVAGPIVRAVNFLPQLDQPRRWQRVDVRASLILFLVGFIKKACISDRIAGIVDPVFADPEMYTSVSIALATLFYAVQIYCDFSGYSDMAIAVAGLLGYQLPRNFNFPYFAACIADFWSRWHISLSTWLRDYLYIPLGGNRAGVWRIYRNLMITMLLGGLWHGAGWNFLLWGGLHGAALVAHRTVSRRGLGSGHTRLPLQVLGMLTTFAWVCLMWIFFRATSLSDALLMVRSLVFWQSPGELALDVNLIWDFLILAIAHVIAWQIHLERIADRWPDWLFWILYGAAASLAISMVATVHKPFIYFQF